MKTNPTTSITKTALILLISAFSFFSVLKAQSPDSSNAMDDSNRFAIIQVDDSLEWESEVKTLTPADISENAITIFPNPFRPYITLVCKPEILEEKGLKFSLYDLNGKEVLRFKKFKSEVLFIDTKFVTRGVYNYKITCNRGLLEEGQITRNNIK